MTFGAGFRLYSPVYLMRMFRLLRVAAFIPLLIGLSLTSGLCSAKSGSSSETSLPGPKAVTVSEDGNTTTYNAAFFDQFEPLTLRNMIDRIPGVSIEGSASGSDRRGLRGSQDAILINGQQVIGKNNDGSSALAQVLASQVEYIEIIRGSSSEVQSTTQKIINVVLKSDAQSVTQVQASLLFYEGDDSARLNPTVIYSANNENNNYTLFFRSLKNVRPWTRTKLTTDQAGAPRQRNDELESLLTHKVRATGRFEQVADSGSRLQLSSYLEGDFLDRERRESAFTVLTPQNSEGVSDILEIDKRDKWTTELSADYSRPIGKSESITVLGFFNWQEESRDREVLDLFGPTDLVVTRQARKDVKTESIIRGTYDRTPSKIWGFQYGLEGTLNTQETDFDLQTREGDELVPLPVFNSNGTVTEYRGEFFSTARWHPIDDLSFEFGVAIEASRISQASDDVDNSRFLSYVKPSLSAFWNVTPSDRLFFSIVRDVQQLDFLEFVATITDRDQELEAGNPNLLPEKSWDATIGYEHGLGNGAGLISVSGFYRRVEDVAGRVLFRDLISQPGNIGSGSEKGGEAELSLQFTRLGWWDGILTTKYLYRDTSVTDPFSDTKRSFDQTSDWEFEVSYRHDVDTVIDGYVNLSYSENGRKLIHDIDYIENVKDSGTLSIVLAHQIQKNMELRATVRNLVNDGRIRRDRQLFEPDAQGGRQQIGSRFERHEWGKFFSLVLNWNV